MYTDILQELGLSPNEARIYEALLELGESSISDIATHTNIHRRNVYDAINRLVEKGFIVPVIGSEERRYVPIEPRKFLENIEEKRTKLEKVLPDMENLFKQKKAKEGVYIYKGIEGYRNVLRDILSVAQDGYAIGAKGIWTVPSQDPFTESYAKETIKKKIKFQTLFDATLKNQMKEIREYPNITYRFLPEKYSTPTAIDIYGDRVVIYASSNLDAPREDITLFMMISQKLADSYRQWFQFMWDRCSTLS